MATGAKITGLVTRWWWVRHAPVIGVNGRIYGQDDLEADTSDAARFAGMDGVPAGEDTHQPAVVHNHHGPDAARPHVLAGLLQARLRPARQGLLILHDVLQAAVRHDVLRTRPMKSSTTLNVVPPQPAWVTGSVQFRVSSLTTA